MSVTNSATWPSFTEEEGEAVKRVLMSNKVNYWTGDECREFEREFAEFAGTRYAIALMNGSVALIAALKALGIGEGDEVIVTPRSYVASASSVVFVGATPVFADVDRDSQNITAESVSRVLTSRTRAIIPVHLAGWPCDMDGLRELADQHQLSLVEDCAQAHGAHYRGKSVGSFGEVNCWSFCQDKIITTGGEGGMLTTDDPDLWRKLWAFKENGRSRDATFEEEHPPGFRWLHRSFGTNLRMTEMQAIIGRIQLGKIDQWTRTRQALASALDQRCRVLVGLRVPEIPEHVGHARYRHYVFVIPEKLKAGWSRDRIVHEINARGFPCFQGSCPEIYREQAFASIGMDKHPRLTVARELGETSLAFLVHPTLSLADIKAGSDILAEVLSMACKQES